MRRFAFLALLFVTGCIGGANWRNPNLPPQQESIDERVCRHEAEEDLGPQPYSEPGTEKYDTPMQMVDRSELRNQFDGLVADCLERKGYHRDKN